MSRTDKILKNEVEHVVSKCTFCCKAYRPHTTVAANFTKRETDEDKVAPTYRSMGEYRWARGEIIAIQQETLDVEKLTDFQHYRTFTHSHISLELL